MTIEEANEKLTMAAQEANSADNEEDAAQEDLTRARTAHAAALNRQSNAYDRYRAALRDWQKVNGFPVLGNQ
jgi:hypothetical protein